jgi:hypothetical protein
MTGVDHGAGLDEQAALPERRHPGHEPPPGGRAPDRRDELGALVGHQPGVQPAARLGARSAIDHDAQAGMEDEQPGRRVARRVHRADAERHEPHGRY